MVSTVEIFDPRNGLWSIGEPMNNTRGYSGTVVIGGKIYIIGGIKDSGEILDTVCQHPSTLPILNLFIDFHYIKIYFMIFIATFGRLNVTRKDVVGR